MSIVRLALLVLLCLVVPGWASAHALTGDSQPTDTVSLASTNLAASRHQQMSMMVVHDDADGDCDHDGCVEGRCRHRCTCGCGMGLCASPSAMAGPPWTFPAHAATLAVAPLIAQVPAAARGIVPLRPPIA